MCSGIVLAYEYGWSWACTVALSSGRALAVIGAIGNQIEGIACPHQSVSQVVRRPSSGGAAIAKNPK